MANIRRLTVTVLDNLETRSNDRMLDQAQKRLLSTGVQLLRLWRSVLREGGSKKAAGDLGRIEGVLSTSGSVNSEDEGQ